MKISIMHHHYHYYSDENLNDQFLKQLSLILKNQNKIMTDLTELTTKVEKNGSVIESAVTLLTGLKAQLDAAGTDPVALKALSDQLGSETDSLAVAVAANAPVAPPASPAV